MLRSGYRRDFLFARRVLKESPEFKGVRPVSPVEKCDLVREDGDTG
jgi:hypothetical protein